MVHDLRDAVQQLQRGIGEARILEVSQSSWRARIHFGLLRRSRNIVLCLTFLVIVSLTQSISAEDANLGLDRLAVSRLYSVEEVPRGLGIWHSSRTGRLSKGLWSHRFVLLWRLWLRDLATVAFLTSTGLHGRSTHQSSCLGSFSLDRHGLSHLVSGNLLHLLLWCLYSRRASTLPFHGKFRHLDHSYGRLERSLLFL